MPTPSSAADHQLLADHLAGVRGAFDVIYRRHFTRLVSAARQQGSLEPQDAAQETLARAAAKATTYPGAAVCSVETWLRRILRNVVIDVWRWPSSPRSTVQLSADVRVSTPNLETARHVRAALAELPPEQAEALELHYCVGLTAVEISSRLRVNENTVKGRIRLGSAKLRAAMTETREGLV